MYNRRVPSRVRGGMRRLAAPRDSERMTRRIIDGFSRRRAFGGKSEHLDALSLSSLSANRRIATRAMTPARLLLAPLRALTRASAPASRATVRPRLLAPCAASDARAYSSDDANVKSYALTGRGSGVTATVLARHHEIRLDLPKTMGGADGAPQPVELLVAALIGCEQATAAYCARHMQPRFPLKHVHFTYAAARDDLGATSLPITEPPPVSARMQRVTGTAVVHLSRGAETSERVDQLRRLVEARCPVANTLVAAGCELDVEWKLADR